VRLAGAAHLRYPAVRAKLLGPIEAEDRFATIRELRDKHLLEAIDLYDRMIHVTAPVPA
jgi:hypothetical protein